MLQAGVWSKPYLLSMTRFRPPKTNEQCALLHVLWREIAIQAGTTEDYVKAYFKERYGPQKVIEIKGESQRIKKSVAEYTREEISAMIERTYQVGADWGVEFAEVA